MSKLRACALQQQMSALLYASCFQDSAVAAMQHAQLYQSLHAVLFYVMLVLQVAPFDLLNSLEQLNLDERQIRRDALTLPVQEEASSAAQKILSIAGSSKQ